MSANGPLLVLDARGGMGSLDAGAARILAVSGGGMVRILAREAAYPYTGGIAPSPRGRYVAYGENRAIAQGRPPQTQGLWVVPVSGGTPRRVLLPPPSTQGNRLDIGPVAWSPDRYTLAYAVVVAGEGVANPQKERALGIWLTRYDRDTAHQVATNAALGIVSATISRLSWAPDAHTLVVSTFLQGAGGSRPAVLMIDTTTGRVRTLVDGGQDAAASPTTGALAYVSQVGQKLTLWAADEQGRHRRALMSGSTGFMSPVWSSDGRTIAYIAHPSLDSTVTAVRTVDVATGQVRTVIASDQSGQPLLLVKGYFQSLAWMRPPA